MAEINLPAASPKRGVTKSKKLSTKVDLTPMVDLGFLLITFFIFTTSLSEKKTTKLNMPANGTPMQIALSTALTVIPVAGKVFFYHGEWNEALAKGTYGFTGYAINNGIGNMIRQKQAAMNRQKPGYGKELMLIIKPDTSASYKQFVDVLDETLINEVKTYAVTDITAEEAAFIKRKDLHK